MTEITQADRLLLADLFDLPQSKAMELFAGKHDANEAIGTKLQALAAHRIAEREAVVKWLRERDGFNDCYSELKDQWLSDRIARGEYLK